MKKINSFLLSTLFLTSLVSCNKDDNDDSSPVNTNKIENEIKKFQSENNIPSVSVGIIKGDKLIWKFQTGLANIEAGIKANENTIYKLGSISKPITALLVLKLVEQGKMDLDQDINKYLPFTIKNPHFSADKITVRQIMTHTSSIHDDLYEEKLLTDFVVIGEDHPMGLLGYEKEMLMPKGMYYDARTFSNNKPGSSYKYSNVATTLLGAAIEHVSQTSFSEFAKTNLFIPLQMNNSFWKISQVPLDRLAFPYSPDFTNYGPYSMVDLPSGSLHGTVDDLSKIEILLMNNGKSNGVQLFKEGSIKEMKRLQFPNSEVQSLREQALLLEHSQLGQYVLVGHNGSVPGSQTYMWFDPSTKRGVMLMMNSEIQTKKAMQQLVDLLANILDVAR